MSSKESARTDAAGRSPPSTPAMRRDARARREALIRAATQCFAERGYTVPLEEICALAGVGRGTFYRNFRDRAALALAVFEQDIERLEAGFDMTRPIDEIVGDIVRRGAKASALFTRMAIELPLSRENLDDFQHLGARVTAVLQPLVDKGHADGALRRDLGAMDILLGMRMISGLLLPQMTEEEVHAKIDRAMFLLLHGLHGDRAQRPAD